MSNELDQEIEKATEVTGDYGEEQIQVLEGLEAVRKRPGMYIGSTDARGLHHLVYEIVDNSIDEALAGYCTEIDITLHQDGSVSVQDNGRGFPVGIHPKMGRPAVEVCLTVLHAGGKFGGGGYKVSGGLHGVGASVVNALSAHLSVQVFQDGKIYQQEYARGKYLYDLKVVGETDRTGTTIRFLPDVKSPDNPEGIFDTGDFQFDVLKNRLQEMAFLNKGIRIVFRDERGETPVEKEFCYNGGLREFVLHLNRHRNQEALLPPQPIYTEGLQGRHPGGSGHAVHRRATRRTSTPLPTTFTPPEGGTHLMGFRHRPHPRDERLWPASTSSSRTTSRTSTGEDIREGLTAIISREAGGAPVRGPDQDQAGQRRGARPWWTALVSDELCAPIWRSTRRGPGRSWTSASCAHRAREAARKARELTRRKTALESTSACPASWRTAPSGTPASARSSWWRATAPAAAPSRAATRPSRPSCP